MRFNGKWFTCNDGIERPLIAGEVLGAADHWWPVRMLVDTGADQTVLSAPILQNLELPLIEPEDRIGGVGGIVDHVMVRTTLRLKRDDGGTAEIRGAFAGFRRYETLDMSILGRDVLDLFAVIVDRPGDAVCLIRQPHRYRIESA